MEKSNTQIIELPIDSLIGASWNYKTEGTEDQINKLIASITKDKSVGVLAIREVDGGKFEVIDGNHRLVAIRKMGWKKVPCENFGTLSIAQAATIARRRNYNWFEDDLFKLQDLYNKEIFKEFTIEQLETFMPDSTQFLNSMKSLGEMPWEQMRTSAANSSNESQQDQSFIEFKIRIPNETMELWVKLKERYNAELGAQPDYRILEFALIEAMNVPVESLSKGEPQNDE